MLSGMEARVLREGEKKRMDQAALHLGRQRFGVVATNRTTTTTLNDENITTYNEINKVQVMRKLSFSSTDSELRARRLKRWQKMAREPERHAQSLAALLGRSKFELHPSVDEQGRLTD